MTDENQNADFSRSRGEGLGQNSIHRNVRSSPFILPHIESASGYESLPLVELTEHIVESSDRAALHEFHEHRTLFRSLEGPLMLLAPFVIHLCHTPWAPALVGHDPTLLDLAYDLTLDKFAHLPESGPPRIKRSKNGPDCRFYFGSFLEHMKQWCMENPDRTLLEEEAEAARVLQNRVVKNFRFSCLEVKRLKNPSQSRYVWHVNGGTIPLLMPTSMRGSKRRAWLEANVKNPDPVRPGERDRIQALVNEQLSFPRKIPLEGEKNPIELPSRTASPLSSLIEKEVRLKGLAVVVADEKADTLDQQRPAIQKLGRPGLRQLILDIFEDLATGCYEEKRLAGAYGLNRASFSRFAGSRWHSSAEGRPPDLWANMAETLAIHETFVEVAKQAGVWEGVEAVLEKSPTPRRMTDE